MRIGLTLLLAAGLGMPAMAADVVVTPPATPGVVVPTPPAVVAPTTPGVVVTPGAGDAERHLDRAERAQNKADREFNKAERDSSGTIMVTPTR